MGYFDSDAEEMLEVYLLETRQLAGQLSGVLLEAEKSSTFSEADIHSIFRIMHTIKSSSAMMGLTELSSMAHQMEDLFSYYREKYGKIEKAEPKLFDLLYAVSDYIDQELVRIVREDYAPGSAEHLRKTAAKYLESVTSLEGRREDSPDTDHVSAPLPEKLAGRGGVIVKVTFESGCRMENVRAFMLLRKITSLCTCVESYPENLEKAQDSADFIEKNGVFIRFESDRKDEVLDSIRNGLFVGGCEVLQDQPVQAQKQENGIKDDTESREKEFLSVRSDRLDYLQNLSGELTIQMLALESELEENGLEDVKEGTAHQISRLISEVERQVMEIRMVPVEKIVPKLRRILRDICRDLDKEVDFIVQCGDMEADKSVVDYVSESLMHIIRNAVDHGIESPEERLHSGKPRKGRIVFHVESTVGELVLSISDDGRGIDEEKVKDRARKRGLFTKPEEEYSPQEIREFILNPGFTTTERVTEYSGRGVGLDVVRSIVGGAGGHLYVSSEPGKGSSFTITTPLTLATMECVRFRVGDYRFSVPARQVFRFFDYDTDKSRIQDINGHDYFCYEDRMLLVADLRRLYRLEKETPQNAILIYVKGKEREGCILADSMCEQKRIVIKPLPALFGIEFRRKTGINGCSIMGNGRICASLDTEIMFGRYEREENNEV